MNESEYTAKSIKIFVEWIFKEPQKICLKKKKKPNSNENKHKRNIVEYFIIPFM